MSLLRRLLSAILLCVTSASIAHAQQLAPPPRSTSLSRTPPMGWNSWNRFGCNVSDKLIRGVADAIVATGMRDAGYQYVNVDDCWQVGRTSAGQIIADSVRFPAGMKALADYLHSTGHRAATQAKWQSRITHVSIFVDDVHPTARAARLHPAS